MKVKAALEAYFIAECINTKHHSPSGCRPRPLSLMFAVDGMAKHRKHSVNTLMTLLFVWEFCLSTLHFHSWCLRGQESTASSQTRVRDVCEAPCACWKSNPDPQQQQQVLYFLVI